MTRTTAKNQINETLRTTTAGLHKDDFWKPVQAAWKAISDLGFDLVHTGSRYTHDSNGNTDSKIWTFEINLGTKRPLYGILTAHGAWTVDDPLCKYDISAYVS